MSSLRMARVARWILAQLNLVEFAGHHPSPGGGHVLHYRKPGDVGTFHQTGPVTQVIHGGAHTTPDHGIYEVRDAAGGKYHLAARESQMANLALRAGVPVHRAVPGRGQEKFQAQMKPHPVVQQGFAGPPDPLEHMEREREKPRGALGPSSQGGFSGTQAHSETQPYVPTPAGQRVRSASQIPD